jgi:hypothetical protein
MTRARHVPTFPEKRYQQGYLGIVYPNASLSSYWAGNYSCVTIPNGIQWTKLVGNNPTPYVTKCADPIADNWLQYFKDNKVAVIFCPDTAAVIYYYNSYDPDTQTGDTTYWDLFKSTYLERDDGFGLEDYGIPWYHYTGSAPGSNYMTPPTDDYYEDFVYTPPAVTLPATNPAMKDGVGPTSYESFHGPSYKWFEDNCSTFQGYIPWEGTYTNFVNWLVGSTEPSWPAFTDYWVIFKCGGLASTLNYAPDAPDGSGMTAVIDGVTRTVTYLFGTDRSGTAFAGTILQKAEQADEFLTEFYSPGGGTFGFSNSTPQWNLGTLGLLDLATAVNPMHVPGGKRYSVNFDVICSYLNADGDYYPLIVEPFTSAAEGQYVINVPAGTGVRYSAALHMTVIISDADNTETNYIESISGDAITMHNALSNTYTSGTISQLYAAPFWASAGVGNTYGYNDRCHWECLTAIQRFNYLYELYGAFDSMCMAPPPPAPYGNSADGIPGSPDLQFRYAWGDRMSMTEATSRPTPSEGIIVELTT